MTKRVCMVQERAQSKGYKSDVEGRLRSKKEKKAPSPTGRSHSELQLTFSAKIEQHNQEIVVINETIVIDVTRHIKTKAAEVEQHDE